MVRFKNRYICFEVLYRDQYEHLQSAASKTIDNNSSHSTLNPKTINNLVRELVRVNFGDLGVGQITSGCQVKYFSSHTRLGIIKVPRDHSQMVATALALATHINKNACIIRVLHVSGTIKKCQRAAIRTDRELIIACYRRQQALAKAGSAPITSDSTLAAMLNESQTQISALEL